MNHNSLTGQPPMNGGTVINISNRPPNQRNITPGQKLESSHEHLQYTPPKQYIARPTHAAFPNHQYGTIRSHYMSHPDVAYRYPAYSTPGINMAAGISFKTRHPGGQLHENGSIKEQPVHFHIPKVLNHDSQAAFSKFHSPYHADFPRPPIIERHVTRSNAHEFHPPIGRRNSYPQHTHQVEQIPSSEGISRKSRVTNDPLSFHHYEQQSRDTLLEELRKEVGKALTASREIEMNMPPKPTGFTPTKLSHMKSSRNEEYSLSPQMKSQSSTVSLQNRNVLDEKSASNGLLKLCEAKDALSHKTNHSLPEAQAAVLQSPKMSPVKTAPLTVLSAPTISEIKRSRPDLPSPPKLIPIRQSPELSTESKLKTSSNVQEGEGSKNKVSSDNDACDKEVSEINKTIWKDSTLDETSKNQIFSSNTSSDESNVDLEAKIVNVLTNPCSNPIEKEQIQPDEKPIISSASPRPGEVASSSSNSPLHEQTTTALDLPEANDLNQDTCPSCSLLRKVRINQFY